MANIDPETRKELEKNIYLQTLDKLWREHLYEMDTLKTGIGLRGYNQKDPLTEYKQESYHLFENLIRNIKKESIQFVHRVDLSFFEPQPEINLLDGVNSNKNTQTQEEENSINKQESQTQEQITPTAPIVGGKKPKRNDPCPCGSGEKYKNCCGKSGPKKGILAQWVLLIVSPLLIVLLSTI